MNSSHATSFVAGRAGAAISLFHFLLCAIVGAATAQQSTSPFEIGASAVGTIPVTEGNDVNPSWGLRGLLRYGWTGRLGLEFGIAYLNYLDLQKEYDQLDVEGTALAIDVRARVSFGSAVRIRPYVFVGIGLTFFDADNDGTHLSPAHEHGDLTGTYVHVPVGAGAIFPLSDNLGVELQAGNNLGLSDGLNPNLDGTNDHLWIGTAGVYYRFGVREPNEILPQETDADPVGDVAAEEPDADPDGLGDTEETERYRIDPMNRDSDGDGLSDGEEARKHRTDPGRADTDGDGLKDGDEVSGHRTNPLKVDTDGDGLTDGAEVLTYGTNPNRADTDGDGLSDGEEVKKYRTDPLKAE